MATTDGNGYGPWLDDYDEFPPIKNPDPTSSRLRSDDPGKRHLKPQGPAGGSEPPQEFTIDEARQRRQIKYYLKLWTMAMILLLALSVFAEFISKKFDKPILDADSDISQIHPENSEDLAAIRLQVRSTMTEAKKYLKDHGLGVLARVLTRWNSSEGFYIHGNVPKDIPVFFPEPRPGQKDGFLVVVEKGLQDVELHAFEFISDHHLSRVASKCGLTNPDGDEVIRRWSTWKEGKEEIQKTRCKEGGWCIVLTYGCTADAFD